MGGHWIVGGPEDDGAVRPFLAAQALAQLHQQGAAEGPGVGVLRVTPHLVGYLTQRAGGGRAEFAVEAERAVFFGQQTGAAVVVGPQLDRVLEQHQRRLALADQSAAPRLEEVGLEQRRIEPHRVIEERSEEHTSELQSLMRISYAV